MNIKNITGENKTASIGISFDIPNEKEIIAIGSPDRLKAFYTQFYNNTNNQKRKLKRSPEALEQYNVLFNELKEKALTMKRGLSDDRLRHTAVS